MFSIKALIKKHFNWYLDKLKADSVDAYSAQVAFFIIIAFIPFALFLLSLLQSININGTSILNSAMVIFPKEVQEFLSYVLFQRKEPITLISVAALTCLWSSSKAMLALMKGLNSVFDVRETRNFIWLRIISVGYTIIFAAVIAATVVILVFGNLIYNAVMQRLGYMDVRGMPSGKFLIGFIILSLFFTIFYRAIPRKARISFCNCCIGGALAAGGWVLFSFFFSIFVENFANYSGMYGSLAALVILMLWLYFCMYIVFFGGETAVWLETGGFFKDIKCLCKKHKTFQTKEDVKNHTNKP